MRTLAIILTLAGTASAVTPGPVTVKPEWTLPRTTLVGFTQAGDPVTRQYPAPTLSVLDINTGKSKRTIVFPEVGNDMGNLAFSPDLTTQAWMNRVGDTLTVRTPNGRWTSSIPGLRGTRGMKFSPDGKTLTVWNVLGYVQLWDVVGGERLHTLMLTGQPEDVAFHPSQPVLAVSQRSGKGGFVTFWNINSGQKLLALDDVQYVSRPFTFLPDEHLLLGSALIPIEFDTENGLGKTGTPINMAKYVEKCAPGVVWKSCLRGFRNGSVSADGQSIGLNIARTPQDIPALLIYNKAGMLQKIVDTPSYVATLAPDGRHLLLGGFNGELAGASLP